MKTWDEVARECYKEVTKAEYRAEMARRRLAKRRREQIAPPTDYKNAFQNKIKK